MIPAFILALVVAMGVGLGPLVVLLPAVLAVPIFYAWAVQRGVTEHARAHGWRSSASPWPQRIVAAVGAFGFALVVWPMLDSRVTVTLVVAGVVALVAPMIAALLAWRRDGRRTLRSDMIACSPVLVQALIASAALAFESGTLAHLAIVAVFESLLTPWAVLLSATWIVFLVLQHVRTNAPSQPAAYRTAMWLVAVVGTIALLRHAAFQWPEAGDLPVVGIAAIVLAPVLAFMARRSYRRLSFSIAAVTIAAAASETELWPEVVALVGTALVVAAGPLIEGGAAVWRTRGATDTRSDDQLKLSGRRRIIATKRR